MGVGRCPRVVEGAEAFVFSIARQKEAARTVSVFYIELGPWSFCKLRRFNQNELYKWRLNGVRCDDDFF